MELRGLSVDNFLKGFNSDATKESYSKKLRSFLESVRLSADELLAKTAENPRFTEHLIIDYVESRRGKVSGSTLRQLKDALRHFFEMNDLDEAIKWPKISRIMPHAKRVGNDRAPTVEEVRIIVENADLRTQCIVLLMCSSGVRVGAFDYLAWRDLKPIDNGKLTFAKLTVYRDHPEQYTAFVTPEAYFRLLEYRRRRESVGEKIAVESPLIRDAWDSKNSRRNRRQDPVAARTLSSKAIRNQIGEHLRRIGLRNGHSRAHEFKQVHGFRKFFKTNAERVMKTIDVEKLLGHAENYYKPGEEYLSAEYAKAIPYLTISEAEMLKRQGELRAAKSDKRVGELERENLTLQDRLTKIEGEYRGLKEMVETYIQTRRRDSPLSQT